MLNIQQTENKSKENLNALFMLGGTGEVGSSAASTISTLSTTSGVSSASGLSGLSGASGSAGDKPDQRQALAQLSAMGYSEVLKQFSKLQQMYYVNFIE